MTGYLGKIHPLVCENYGLPSEVYVAEIDIADALSSPVGIAKYAPISKLPPVDRDLALVVERGVPVGTMLAAAKATDPRIVDVKLFDIYKGEQIPDGYKSVAFSMRLQPSETTFSDTEIKSIVDRVISVTSDKFGAKLR